MATDFPGGEGKPPTQNDDLITSIRLQLQELGAARGEQFMNLDRNLSPDEFQDALSKIQTILSDHQMAKSMAKAVHQDYKAITQALIAEDAITQDRLLAFRVAKSIPNNEGDKIPVGLKPFRKPIPQPDTVLLGLDSTEAGSSTGPDLQLQAIKAYNRDRVPCGVCGKLLPKALSICCPCRHVYCRDCLRSFTFMAIKDEAMYPLKCCKQEVPRRTIFKILEPAEYQQYLEVGIEYSTPNRQYCTKKDCLKFIPLDRINGNVAVCKACQTKVCTLCKNEAHQGRCEKDQNLEFVMNIARENGLTSKQIPDVPAKPNSATNAESPGRTVAAKCGTKEGSTKVPLAMLNAGQAPTKATFKKE
ncbi:hypothetical protein ABW19_dt0201319 [Dactylella cylindrospora]|nr:hypothetical protein ABW19_dt0201319 [Dactylella cylindrospora]